MILRAPNYGWFYDYCLVPVILFYPGCVRSSCLYERVSDTVPADSRGARLRS